MFRRFRAWLVSVPSYRIGGWIVWFGMAAMLSPISHVFGDTAGTAVVCVTYSGMLLSYALLGLQAHWERK